ncbi:biotin/lipoyl-binding protein [Synechococcus sp. 1G10]|uniref:biotin/lipoyl-binding protein n=1 Tax=Synechococcus sp. 1G10 TaxID=2025605 RepID=UPI000B98339B|nr:biotin/lipoyl-binding protein [Synechococcus sp. 1G10]
MEHASLRRHGFGHARLLAIPLALIATTAGAGGWVLNHWGVVETDDAQLQGTLTPISSRLPGSIDHVAVKDNQTVRPGQLLFSLDDRNDRASVLADQALVTAGTAAAEVRQATVAVAAARLRLSCDRVVAPEAGRIGAKQAEPGMQVMLHAPYPSQGQWNKAALQLLSAEVNRQASLLAFGDVFRTVAALFLAVVPLVLLLGKPEPNGPG